MHHGARMRYNHPANLTPSDLVVNLLEGELAGRHAHETVVLNVFTAIYRGALDIGDGDDFTSHPGDCRYHDSRHDGDGRENGGGDGHFNDGGDSPSSGCGSKNFHRSDTRDSRGQNHKLQRGG